MADADSGRISVSRDALRLELAQMELRLIEKLATKDEVKVIHEEHDALRDEVENLKSWRQYTTGLTAGSMGLAALAAGFAAHLF